MSFDHKTPLCRLAFALFVWGTLLSRVEGQNVTEDVVCETPLELDGGSILLSASSSLNGLSPADVTGNGWCPNADDDSPCLTVNLTTLTAVNKIQFLQPVGRPDDYAETWYMQAITAHRDDFRTVYTNLSALRDGEKHSITFIPPFVLKAFKICPRTNTGLPCVRVDVEGCENDAMCPAVTCPGSTECIGVNYCRCAAGQFGPQCDHIADTVEHKSVSFDGATVEEDATVTYENTTLVTGTGFEVNGSSLMIVEGFSAYALRLQGTNVYVSLPEEDCFRNLRTCTAFTISMGLSVSFDADNATFPIFASNYLAGLSGVSVTVEEGHLVVRVLAEQYGWNTTLENILAEDVCVLPQEAGMCDREWYYSTESSQCERFRWGMCGGNNNTFSNRKECEDACVESGDNCTLSAEPVECPKPEVKYFYNGRSRECQQFHSHSCGGNGNNFDDVETCEDTCINNRKATLVSGRWYKFTLTWSTVSHIRIYINNRRVQGETHIEVLQPLTDPFSPPATSQLTMGYSSVIESDYETNLAFEGYNFWRVSYSAVAYLVDSFGDCAQCYGPGSLGCYDNETCTCREGYLGQFCNQTADSRFIGFISFESIGSGVLYSSLGSLMAIEGDVAYHNKTVFTCTGRNAEQMSFDFDIGCIGNLSCRDGFTFSSKASFSVSTTVVLFSIKSIESQSEVTLYYTQGNLVVYLAMGGSKYFIQYGYTPSDVTEVFAVSYSAKFGLSLIVGDLVVAKVTEVSTEATLEAFFQSLDLESLGNLTMTSFGYAGFHYSQLAMAAISISDVCGRDDFCANGGVCKGLSGCECEDGFTGFRCDIKDKQDIVYSTMNASTLLQEGFLGFSVMARGSYRAVGSSVILDSRSQSSFLQIETLNQCLRNPERCFNGITMSIDFAVKAWDEGTIIVLLSTGGDRQYSGFYLAYDVEQEQYICVYQTFRRRWSLRVDYDLSLNSRLNIGFSWSMAGLSLFVDNVLIGQTEEYEVLEYGEVTMTAGSLRLGSCYTGLSTQTWEMRIYSYSTYSASLSLLSQQNILKVVNEQEEEKAPCENNPCVNGQCRNQGDSYECRCYFGFSGQNCDTSVSGYQAYRFSFLSVVRMEEYVSIKTTTFPLRGYGNVTLFRRGNTNYVRCTGGRSNVQLNFRRLQHITSLFMTKTLSDTSAFSFSFNFRLVAQATSTTRLMLFSMGGLEDGDLQTTGMIVYYMDGKIYITLSLPQRKYQLSFDYTLQLLSELQTFACSFDLTTGLVIRTTINSTLTFSYSQAIYTVQSYETSEVYEAYIGSRNKNISDYVIEIGNCGFAEETIASLEANNQTLGLCAVDYCQNNGSCEDVDQCLCDETSSFTGPDCSLTQSNIVTRYNYFSSVSMGTITTTEGLTGTTHGDVDVTTETTLTASNTGTYIELDSSSNTCLSDLSRCSAGLTMCLDMTFKELADDSHLCLISTGGETSYGMSLTFDNDEHVLSSKVKLPYRTWSVDASFEPELNTNYNICLSWSRQGGVAISVNNKITAHQRGFVFSKVFMTNWAPSRNLRFGSCYGVVHTETWSYSMKSYQYYNASLQYLAQLEVITVDVPKPPAPPVTEMCEITTFKATLKSIVSSSLELFSLAVGDRVSKCNLLKDEFVTAEASVRGCWDEEDRLVSSSSPLSFIRYTQQSNLHALRAIHTLLCTEKLNVTDATCDLTMIATKVEAFFAATNADSFSIGICSNVRNIYMDFKVLLDSCESETVDMMASIQVSMETTVRSVCAKSTCNIGYATSCINESITLITSLDNEDDYTQGVCKRIKQSMACFTNHTVDCGADTYRSLSRRVEDIHQTYQQHCFLKPHVPADPDDCEAQTADQLDQINGLLATVTSKFFNQSEMCSLMTAKKHLLLEVPEDMEANRLAEFLTAQQILQSISSHCKIYQNVSTCTCDIEAAHECKKQAEILLRDMDVNCTAVGEQLTCFREKTQGCENVSAVYAMVTEIGSYLKGATECDNVDPGPKQCLVCGNTWQSCTMIDACSSEQVQCMEDRLKHCGVMTRMQASLGYQEQYNISGCTGDLNSAVTSLRGSNYPLVALERCLQPMLHGPSVSLEDNCNRLSMFDECIRSQRFEKPYDTIVAEMINSTRHLMSFCNKDRPDFSSCPPPPDCLMSVGVPVIIHKLYGFPFSSYCGEENVREIGSCYPQDCADENVTMYYEQANEWSLNTMRNSCSILPQEETAPGCDKQAAGSCVKNLAAMLLTKEGHSCGAVAAAQDCVHVNIRQCPQHVKDSTQKMMKMLNKLNAKECCQARESTCDPAAAVMCVIDITHLARMPSPDWEGICGRQESSMDCMRNFTESCDECQKNTVHYIAQRLNEDIVETCRNPPKTRCKLTQALACVDRLRDYAALTDSDEVFDDVTCLRVHEAQNCIKAQAEECDDTVRFTIDYQLSKVVKLLDAEECTAKAMAQNCGDIFRERVEDILKYDPRAPDIPRCKLSGMKGPVYTDLEECKPDLTCKVGLVPRHRATLPRPGKGPKDDKEEDKNTKEKDTKEKDTKEKDTKEKDTKEKNTKEKDTKEKNTKEKDTKEKDTKEKNTKEKNTKEKNTKEKNTKEKNTKEKNTKEKDTKEKDTKEKNTKEKNTKEKDTKEKDTKEKNTKEKDTKEKDTKEKDTKENDTKEKDTKENTKEKDTKEKNTKEKNSKEKNSKELEEWSFDWSSTDPHWVCVPQCDEEFRLEFMSGSVEDENEWQCVSREEESDEEEKGKKGSKECKDSNSKSKECKESDERTSESNRPVFKNRLDHLCSEAKSAWNCVTHDLKGKQDSKSTVLMQTLSGLWALATQKCEIGEEEFYCYSCDGELDNDQCNRNKTVCSNKENVCLSRVHRNDDNEILSLRKGCAASKDCAAGCSDGVCTYCCPDGGCNKPLEGPVSPVCSVSYAAKCALTLTQTLSSSSQLDCSAFEVELTCMREVREKCVTENQYQLMNLTQSLYQSAAFKKCLLKLAPPTCSLHSVVSLGMILTSSTIRRQEVCQNYDATYEAVMHAKMTEGCSSSLLRQIDSSLSFARSQLSGFGCASIDPNKDHCKPELQSCSIEKAQECVKGIDKLVERVAFNERTNSCRQLVNMSSCLMRYSKDCSVTQAITMKAIKERFEVISSGLRGQCQDEVKASSCETDKERRCQPMTAVTSCFRDFSIANVFDECQNVKLVKSCIMDYTRGCMPIQKKIVGTLLWLQPKMADIMNRCPKDDEEEEEETPYTQIMTCLGGFSTNLQRALSRPCNSLARVCTDSINIVQNCLVGLDLSMQARLSPLERYYISDAVNVVKYLRQSFCQAPEPAEEIDVSVECQAGYDKAARCVSFQTLGVITRPFLPVTQVNSFCRHFFEIESCVESSLSVCTAAERTTSITTYLDTLRLKTYTTCMDRYRAPATCTPKVAEGCLLSLTAYMANGNVSADQQCRALNITLQCVKNHTFECANDQVTRVNIALSQVTAKFSDACPALVKPLLCTKSTANTCSMTVDEVNSCVNPLSSIVLTPNSLYEIEMSLAVEEALTCLRGLSVNCTDSALTTALTALNGALPTGVSLPRQTTFTIDDLRPSCPIMLPKCSVIKAMTCLESRYADFSGSNILDIARGSAQCIWTNISGCDTIQLSIFKISVTQIFSSQLTLVYRNPSPFSVIISTLSQTISSALLQPQYGLWDICFATARISEAFEKVFVTAGEGNMIFERTLLQKGRAVLERFTSFACNDIDLVGEDITIPVSEPATCQKATVVRRFSYYLVESIFSGFLTTRDTVTLCMTTSFEAQESTMAAISTCSAGFKKQLSFAHKHLLMASTSSVCLTSKVCDIERASQCMSSLSLTVSKYGLSKTQEDVCATLRYTDKCVEDNTFRCVYGVTDLFQSRYSTERNIAMQICGGLNEETFIPRCGVDRVKYRDTCSKKEAMKCISSFVDNVVMRPTLSRGRQCAEYTTARQCVQKAASGCVAHGNQMSYSQYIARLDAFFGNSTCNIADYEEECEDGCQLQEAEQCISSLHMKVLENKNAMGTEICVSITEARACLTSRTWKCSNALKTRLSGKLDVVLRTANLHDVDCVNIYGCMADFEGLTASIFNLQEDDVVTPRISRPIMAQNASLSLDSLCALSYESWKCLENGFHLLPVKKGRIIKMTLTNMHRAVQYRCANTVRQRCYVCDGEESNEECNTNSEQCGDHYQACENIVRRGSDNVLRYYKSCVRPSFCGLSCTGEDCSSSCCVGDMCNEAYNAQTDIDPVTCRIDYAMKCSISLVRSIVDYDNIQCRSSQLDLECMEKYSRDCRSDSFSSLSSTAYQVLSSISRMSCSINVTSAKCGSKAILSTYSILKGGYTTLSDKICIGVNETKESVKRIEEQGVCTLTELIPVRQSLSIIQQQTRHFCSRGDNSASCEIERQEETEVAEGRCSGQFFKTARCLVHAIRSFTGNGSAYCNTYRSETSCKDHLKYCDVPDSIKGLMTTVTGLDAVNCGAAVTATCHLDVCNLVEARACYEDSVFSGLTAGGYCPSLREAQTCVAQQTSACFSLQEVTVTEGFNAKVEELGAGCDIEELEMKDDIFTDLTVCLVQYTDDLEAAMFSENDIIGGMCSAYSNSKTCTSKIALPLLSNNFTRAALHEYNQGFEKFLEGRCDEDEDEDSGQLSQRRKRQGQACGIAEAAKCMKSFNLLSWTIATAMIGDRAMYCREMEDLMTCERENMAGCSNIQKEMMTAAMSKAIFNKYCIPLIYKEEGCDVEMIVKSKNAIQQLMLSAEVDNEEVCVNAYRSLKWIKKFSKSCTDGDDIMQDHRQYFGGVLGNSCPKLTVGLFCGKDAPKNRSCQHELAEFCLESIDLSIEAEALPGFCSDLISNVTCVRHNVDGCLASEIDDISTGMSQLQDDITARSCEVDETLLDYDNVCTAKPTCSIKGARKCLQDLLDDSYSLSDCSLYQRKKDCMRAHIQGCNSIQILIAEGLYSILLPEIDGDCSSANIFPLATSPFKEANLSANLLDEMNCLSLMLSDLESSLLQVTFNPLQSFCSLVNNYVNCRGKESFGMDPLNKFLDSRCSNSSMSLCGSTEDICKNGSCVANVMICDGNNDCSDGSDEEDCDVVENDACSPRKASFCLLNQFSSTVMAPYLSLSDKEDTCNQRDNVETCVTARTAACSDRVKDFFKDTLEFSASLLDEQQTCEEPEMCIVEQAYDCIDKLAVVVAKLDLAEDNTVMCTQYLATKRCVKEFTATCSEKKLELILADLNEVEVLIDDKCDDTEEPEVPDVLCPDIPEEERKCEVFKAMDCTLASYTTIFVYNPTNSWENSKSCYALQSTIHCVASNISGCDPMDAKAVITRLNEFRDKMKDRCLLVDTSLCGMPGPCPVDEAHCVKDFKTQLASPTDRGVCEIIEEAQDCISINTINCSPQSWAQADFNLQKAMGEMKVKVRCDDVNIDECMLTFQHQAEKILISGVDNMTTICDNIGQTFTCLNDRLPTAQIADAFEPILEQIVSVLQTKMGNVCSESVDPCSDSQSIRNLLEIGVYLATTPTFNKQEFCSNVGLSLSKVDSSGLSPCDSSGSLSRLKTYLDQSFTSLCQTTVGCQQLKDNALACIGGINSSFTCSQLHSAQICVGESIGQCPSNRKALMDAYTAAKSTSFPACPAIFPLISYSLSTGNDIYMTEGGPSVSFDVINEEYTSFTPLDQSEIRMRVELEATTTTVPLCSDGREISQLVTDKCEQAFNGQSGYEFMFTAVADNRIDGYQEVTGTLKVDYVDMSETEERVIDTLTISPYKFVIQDRDVKSAICSSINDPHLRTFDGMNFNYMGTGLFLFYQSLGELKVEVQLEFATCGESGSCNIGVYIRVDNDVIVFDRSENNKFKPFVPELKIQGDFTKAVKIMKSADSKVYQIVVATGQIIKVRNTDGLPNVWVLASAYDRDNTRGLCGPFDGDRYNDLMMPNGTQYTIRDGDVTYGSLTPNAYTRQWSVAQEDDLVNGLQQEVADTTYPETCSACSTGNSVCSIMAATETCDLIRDGSTDMTKQLVTMALQESGEVQRKKRQAINPNTDLPEPGWPTSSGWTEANATQFCENQVEDPQLTKLCEQAALMVNSTFESEQHIIDCVADIRLSDRTTFVLATLNDLKLKCVDQISKDPNFIKDPELKKLVDEILSLYCYPSDCNGNGRCIKGNCKCDPGYLGSDCSINKEHLQPPVINGLRNNGLCRFSETQKCSEIYVEGGNFVESELLTCHMEFVEIDSTGYRQIGGKNFIVAAERISEELVTCKVTMEVMKRSAVLVTVSNDGVNHPNHEVFIAYDPTCHDCSPTSRRCYGPIAGCDIEGRCHTAGAVATNDTCLECQPESNPNLWTQKSGLLCTLTEVSGQTGSDLKTLIAIPVASAVVLFAVLAVIIALIMKRRSRRNRKNQGFQNYPSMYQNPAYEAHDEDRQQTMTSTDIEPQNSFRGRHIYPRANTSGLNMPSDNHC